MFDKQREFHDKVRGSRWAGFFGGAGSGKTTAGAMEAVYQVVKYPGPPLLIVAPTYVMLKRVTERKFLEVLPREIIKLHNKSDHHIELVNGTLIDFASTQNPESLYGSTVGRIWIDEGPLIPDVAFRILVGRMREGPDETQHGWITGTPKGLNWAYTEFHSGKSDRDAICDICSADNPFVGESFLADQRGSLSGAFLEQEYYGRFVKFEGLIYTEIEDATHLIERPVSEMIRFCAGVDWGYEHPWVFVVAGQDEAGRWHFFDEIHQSHLTTDAQIDLVLDLMRRYSLERVYCPDDRPEGIESYKQAGIPAVSYERKVINGIQVVASALAIRDGKPGCTFSAAVPTTYSEMKQYQWRKLPEDKPGKEEPLKVRDDGPDAVRAILHGEKQQDVGSQEIVLLGDWGDSD